MSKQSVRSVNWRSILGILALLGILATVLAYLIFETRGMATRVFGTATAMLVIAYLATGGLGQLQFFRSRKFFKGSASTVYTIVVLAVLVIVNALAAQTNVRWDLTQEGMFTLSDQTVTALQELDEDVFITGFFPEGSSITDEVRSLLREYEYHSPHIHVRFADPEREPALARQYDITRRHTTVVETGGQQRVIGAQNLYDFSGYMGNEPTDIHFRGEQTFTRTILQMTQDLATNLYFVTGHGEADLYDEYASLRSYLQGEGYNPRQWNPARQPEVPEDADILVIAGPSRDLHRQEADTIQAFVEDGGKLIVLAGAAPGEEYRFSNLDALVGNLGIRLRADAVADPSRAYYMDAFSPVPRMDYPPITSKLIDAELLTVLPLSRSMYTDEEIQGEKGYDVKRILFSSPDSWSETNMAQPNPASAETTGVMALGFAVTRPRGDNADSGGDDGDGDMDEPVAVVMGSASFLENDLLGFQGNSDLFVSAVQWLMDRQELISIGPKRPVPRQVFLSPDEGRMIFYGSTLGLPALVLVIGMVVWIRRRNL